MVAVVGKTPRPVRNQNRSVGKVADKIVKPFVIGESTMTAIVSNHLYHIKFVTINQ